MGADGDEYCIGHKGVQSDQRIKFWHQRKKSVFWEGAAVSQKASDEADI